MTRCNDPAPALLALPCIVELMLCDRSVLLPLDEPRMVDEPLLVLPWFCELEGEADVEEPDADPVEDEPEVELCACANPTSEAAAIAKIKER